MAENVRVVVRSRPMNRRENEMKCKNVVSIENCVVSLENPMDKTAPTKDFTFDCAYDAKAPTEAIYNDICYSLVESVLEGYNATIFACGQTGCGKSHTMQGPEEALLKNSQERILAQRGIISRSFDHIFEAISVATGVRYLALVSYLEIYNETIRDLLSSNSNADASCSKLQLKEIPGEGVVVQNLSTHTVHNVQECENLLMMGAKNRIVGATLMNAESSRSHSIFTISLEQISTASSEAGPLIRKGKLNLVDLAGSERQGKTGATGDRLKEATKINLSLSALGNVISALVDGKTKHIPYRDSKLTRLLQDSLGGNTKTLMVACVSPAEYNYEETLSTLRYASRAKNINNKPRINEDPKDTMLREYQDEIMKLRNLLNSQEHGNVVSVTTVSVLAPINLDHEKENLRQQYDEEVKRLKFEHEIQRKEKEELSQTMEKLKHEYENRLRKLAIPVATVKPTPATPPVINSEAVVERLQTIKKALIGGERSNDVQLKEKRNKKKRDAENRLHELADALNRVAVNEDRDILQRHYSSINQELQIKSDDIKRHRNKINSLEREITDLQSEFQLDRADYLETIRRLERNIKFYKQLFDKALPCLRKDGRYWDVDEIKADATWSDDLQKWKFQEEALSRVKLPPAIETVQPNGRRGSTSLTAPGRLESAESDSGKNSGVGVYTRQPSIDCEENDFLMKKLQNSESSAIIDSYFRPRRVNELLHQTRGYGSWKVLTENTNKNPFTTSWSNQTSMSKTWNGLTSNDANSDLPGSKDYWGVVASRPSYQLAIGQLGPNTQYSQ